MTQVFLVRHGNTFSATDKVVWVGARTDLPLTLEGQQQAIQWGRRLQTLNIKPTLIACGPLLRTREHAQLLKKILLYPQEVQILPALREIDYGKWEGLSSAEIESKGGSEALQNWNEQSIWPTEPGWTPDASSIRQQCGFILKELVQKYPKEAVILVSSNGILRFFVDHTQNRVEFKNLKMKTGHVSELQYDGQNWLIASWNQPPEGFLPGNQCFPTPASK